MLNLPLQIKVECSLKKNPIISPSPVLRSLGLTVSPVLYFYRKGKWRKNTGSLDPALSAH